MNRILVIDDEQAICTSLKFAFEDDYEVSTTTSADNGLEILQGRWVDIVLLDWRLDKDDGLDVLKEIKQLYPQVNVIMMTAYGTIESSVTAMKQGAYYYITKPLNMDHLKLLIRKALEYSHLSKEVKRLNETLNKANSYGGLIGKSKEMKAVFHLIEKVKNIHSNILISGESGTGKELVALAIHNHGQRKNGPFEIVNCAAIPENLLESEFFGHRKGAFTGAISDKVGKFVAADGGTLFLDEIGELPQKLQAKILRVIQEKVVTPLGSNKKSLVNFRLVAATNRDLYEMVQNGLFREDLYFRLNVIPIQLPPLRNKKEDLPLLIQYFLNEYNEKLEKQITSMSSKVKQLLSNYNYPGNVRELSNILEHAVALSNKTTLEMEDLPSIVTMAGNKEHSTQSIDSSIILSMGTEMQEVEKTVILKTLAYHNGHKKNTASTLGISERSLRNKLNQYYRHE